LMLFLTTSAIGPSAVVLPRKLPVFRYVAISAAVQSPRPVERFDDRLSANQPSIAAPLNCLLFSMPPITLRGEWQSLQWPRPSTRYAPRFHAADCAGSGRYAPEVKYSSRHTPIAQRWLNGKS